MKLLREVVQSLSWEILKRHVDLALRDTSELDTASFIVGLDDLSDFFQTKLF